MDNSKSIDLISQMRGFFGLLSSNMDLRPNHLSLYVAILMEWNSHYRKMSFFEIEQKRMMRLSRIGNAGTYTKCLCYLHEKELIRYIPGNKIQRAKVAVNPLIILPPHH